MEAGQVAVGVVAGRELTNIISGFIPLGALDDNQIGRVVKKAGVGLLLSYGVSKVAGRKWADSVLVGAILAPIDELIQPAIAAIRGAVGLSSYYMPRMSGVSSYYGGVGRAAPAGLLPPPSAAVREAVFPGTEFASN
jgi:hypothetical protein